MLIRTSTKSDAIYHNKENHKILKMLAIACENDDMAGLHQLLLANPTIDINEPLQLKQTTINNGKTLLGIAAFNGHIQTVKYLLDVQMANVNSADLHGNTALHQVVYGDSYPFENAGHGTAHDKVAKYLLQEMGDLSIKNAKGDTAFDCTKWCAPLQIERLIGRRFITNTGSAQYYADKVRPIFERELERKKNIHHVTVIGEKKPQAYEDFCLENAIEQYIKEGTFSYGYKDVEHIIKSLCDLPESKKVELKLFVSSHKPSPYSFKYGLIWDQLIIIAKKSAGIGLTTTIARYYQTQNILQSVATGGLTSYVAWIFLTEMTLKTQLADRNSREVKVGMLLKNSGLFNVNATLEYINANYLNEKPVADIDAHLSFSPSSM